MQKRVLGRIGLFLMALLVGCANSVPKPTPVQQMCTVPPHLIKPISAPALTGNSNTSLLELLADYEAMRLRFNADRASITKILLTDVGAKIRNEGLRCQFEGLEIMRITRAKLWHPDAFARSAPWSELRPRGRY